jgi:porin
MRSLRWMTIPLACFISGVVSAQTADTTATAPVSAAPPPPPAPTYSGELWTRSTLTGDWFDARNVLTDRGLDFRFNTTIVGQGVTDGGLREGWDFGGSSEFIFNLDFAKADLWEGASLNILAESSWGESSIFRSGALMPVNTDALFPSASDEQWMLPQVLFTQFLSPTFGVAIGKMITTGGDMNEFAHGKGDTGFMNLAFNLNPALLIAVPYSTLGVAAFWLPMPELMLTASVVDAEGRPDTSGFDTLFDDGTVFSAEGRLTTSFFGLPGHIVAGGTWSSRDFTSLSQDRSIILPTVPLANEENSWAIYGNFDQYIFAAKDQPGQGVGVFGRIAVTDGQANPMKYFYSLGVGGKGVLPSRDHDRFGIGWYHIEFTDENVVEFLGFDNEWGVEAYYEIAVTPWFHLTPDIQFLDGSRNSADDAVVIGLRGHFSF